MMVHIENVTSVPHSNSNYILIFIIVMINSIETIQAKYLIYKWNNSTINPINVKATI